MPPAVRTLVPVLYVASVDVSVTFYRLLGFDLALRGDDGQWAWAYLRSGEVGLLLATGPTPPAGERGPVQMYCQCDDVLGLQERLLAAGAPVEHLGHPEHAPGGELRVTDPDLHAFMIGQVTGTAPDGSDDGSGATRQSILRRAAESVRGRGGADQRCQIGNADGTACGDPAQVKLTDSWGDTAWACLQHADEVILNAPGVYLASEDTRGLGQFLDVRRRVASARSAAQD